MNCNTHGDTAAVAFCRTCGKPLCNNCTRDVRGVIYCEACLAARMEGTASAPAAGFVPPQGPPQTGYQQFMDQGLGVKVQPGPASGPNPAVAGILAGFFPIGVGAVYTGQYAKGLAHLVIMVLMILGLSSDLPTLAIVGLAISTGFFYVYQIIDSIRSAKAIQMGEPAPDPFGLAQTFGAGEKFEATRVPAGAAVLIGLGVLFLLHTAGDSGIWTRSFLAADPDRPRRLALCQALGTHRRQFPRMPLRTLPHPQAHWPRDAGDAGCAFLTRQRLPHWISQDLARHPAGDWRGQADAKQRIA